MVTQSGRLGEGVSKWAWAVIACSLLMEFHGGSPEISTLNFERKFFSVGIYLCADKGWASHVQKGREKMT
jgi:hypothetical protein